MATAIHSRPGLLHEGANSTEDLLQPTDRRPRAWWRRIRVQWHEAVSFIVPVGYQDEQGFHFGPSPAPQPPEQLADLVEQP